MAINEAFTGSAVTIGTGEVNLTSGTTGTSSITTDGIYQLFIDLSNMTSTESYRLRIYEKVLSTSLNQRVVEEVVLYGAQTAQPLYVTPPLVLLHGWTFSMQKLQGTNRAFDWSIRQVA